MPNLSVMIKPASSLCNMRCKYCFYHSLSSTRESFSYGIMTDDTAENLIRNALQFAGNGSIYFAFQGGEPLIAGKEYFHNFIELVHKYNINNNIINYAMQTNGTLVDEDWIKLFKDNKFLIGLSLDGDKNANQFRMDNEYAPVYNQVMDTARLFESNQVDFNILIVATKYTAKHIKEVYNFLTGQGFRFLQFIPCLRPFAEDIESELYMKTDDYSSFLIELFNLYVKDYVRGTYTSIRWFDNIVGMYYGKRAEQCGLMGHCTHQFVIEGNGDVYPCDFYCVDEWKLGNVCHDTFSELSGSEVASRFIKESLVISDMCKACDIYGMCRGGGCKRSRADRNYCSAYKKFYHSCLPLFRVFANEFKQS